MRIIGYIGVAIMLLLFGYVVIFELRRGEWRGIAYMLPLVAMFSVGGFILWEGGRRERQPERKKIMDGWYGESVSSFFVNYVMKTRNGRIFLTGVALSWLFALLAWCCPTAMTLDPAKAEAALFFFWPFFSSILYVMINSWLGFKDNIVSILCILFFAACPFYFAYFS